MCGLTPRDTNGCLLHVTDLLICDEAPMSLAVYWMLVIALSKTTCTVMNFWKENCTFLQVIFIRYCLLSEKVEDLMFCKLA